VGAGASLGPIELPTEKAVAKRERENRKKMYILVGNKEREREKGHDQQL
jgi:hypothetical protein